MKTKTTLTVFTLILVVLTTPTLQVFGPTLSYPSNGEITYGTGGDVWGRPWDDKEDAVPYFMNLANSHGGSYESIGTCSGNKGWDIVLFKFGNPNGGTVMVDSYLHGNEYYGYQVLKSVITWLLTSNDADAVRILQNNYVLVVPVASYRWGRTNYNIPSWMTANDPGNDGDECGVNLNRNFGPNWPSSASSTNGDGYSGASADSEAESQALINAWNEYQPRIYWNLHQGIGPSTSCTARTSQAQEDANEVRSFLSSIQNRLGVSNGWSFSVGSSYGNGYSKDGAASRGSAGFLTEVMSGWDATDSKKADLESGNTFKQVKAMLIAMCQAVEGSSPPPPPPPEQWTITISSSQGGSTSISGTQTVDVGQSLTVTANPNSGYRFDSWRLDGSVISSSRTVTIPSQSSGSSHTLYAVFSEESEPPPSPTTQKTINNIGYIQYSTPTQMRTGVNYEGPYDWHYGVTDAEIDADFALFKQNNVNTVILNIIWSAFQTDVNPASYNQENIANLKRVLAKAEQYGISVCISFFQYWMDTSTGVPSWCIDPKTGNTRYLAIVRDRTIRGYFLEMIGDLVDEFKDSPAIECWSLLNEPMHIGSYSAQELATEREEFHLLIEEGANVIQARDNRPISVRFTLPYSPWHTGTSGGGAYDSFVDFNRVMSVLDFMSIHTYANPDDQSGMWQGTTWAEFFEAVEDTKNAGFDFWVTEFGNNQDDESQRQHYESAVALFQEHGVDACFAWAWVHDDGAEAFNVCYTGGSPRPAFYELNLD